jgi:hypothetical protein
MVENVAATQTEARSFVVGGGPPSISQASGVSSPAAANELAAMVRNEAVEREARQTIAKQRFLDPASRPITLQKETPDNLKGPAEQPNTQVINPADLAAQRTLDANAGRLNVGMLGSAAANQDTKHSAEQDSSKQLPQRSISGQNILQAQVAGSAQSLQVGDDVASPAEQLYGAAAYREATINFQRPSGLDRLTSIFGGGEFSQAGASTAPDPDTQTSERVKNINENLATTDDNTADPNQTTDFKPRDVPGAMGVTLDIADDETTTVTANSGTFDANNDQRQSALNVYELLQQLRTQGQFGITV